MLVRSEAPDARDEALDIRLYILIEAVKLISHADTSSGAVTDVIHYSIRGVEELSKTVSPDRRKPALQAIIKAAKNKAFQDWNEFAYKLLRSAVYFVQDQKEAQAVYDLFPILGDMYGGEEYPDRYIITQGIIERLEGEAAAEQYQLAHIHIKEVRQLVIERALSRRDYARAERLSREALERASSWGEAPVWAYYLERIYEEQGEKDKLSEVIWQIVKRGKRTYYAKLKRLREEQGIWEQTRATVLAELEKEYLTHSYAELLSAEEEDDRLMAVVKENPMLVEPYGRQLAKKFPAETYQVYESYILSAAKAATERRKYKGVCKLIKSFYSAGAKEEAIAMIQQLIEAYPRRAALIDELESLKKKWIK